jgi:hypothetical protein
MELLAVYVDDILIFSNDDFATSSTKNSLNEKFHMKDLGQVSKCFRDKFHSRLETTYDPHRPIRLYPQSTQTFQDGR